MVARGSDRVGQVHLTLPLINRRVIDQRLVGQGAQMFNRSNDVKMESAPACVANPFSNSAYRALWNPDAPSQHTSSSSTCTGDFINNKWMIPQVVVMPPPPVKATPRVTNAAKSSPRRPLCREPPGHGRELVLYQTMGAPGTVIEVPHSNQRFLEEDDNLKKEDLQIISEEKCSIMDRLSEQAKEMSICDEYRDQTPGIGRFSRIGDSGIGMPSDSHFRVRGMGRRSWETPALAYSKCTNTGNAWRDRSRSPSRKCKGGVAHAKSAVRNPYFKSSAPQQRESNYISSAVLQHREEYDDPSLEEPMLMIMDRNASQQARPLSMNGTKDGDKAAGPHQIGSNVWRLS